MLLSSLWNDAEFVDALYDEERFEANVKQIYQENFHFFDDFVKKEFRRQLLLEAMRQEARGTDGDEEKDKNEIEEKKERQPTHTIYYHSNHSEQTPDVDLQKNLMVTSTNRRRSSLGIFLNFCTELLLHWKFRQDHDDLSVTWCHDELNNNWWWI